MKKILAVALALAMALSLAACGVGNEEKPNGSIADIEDSGAQQSTDQPDPSQPLEQIPPVDAQTKVEIKGNTVIHKTGDGMGTAVVSEYIFKDGALSAINMTFECANKAAAEYLYGQMMDGELKETTAQSYAKVKLDGNRILCETTEDYAAAFAGFSQEQVAAMLGGGDPFAGGETIGGASPGGTAGGETTVNSAWSDLTLPDGFPKLAEGVTTFSNDIEGTYTFQWDVMSLGDCEAIAGKLETWSGGAFELMENSGGTNWFVDTGKHSVTLTYSADTFGGAMSQVMLTVTVW